MQWKVSISGKDQYVVLPDAIPNNLPFDATIDGRSVKLRWQKATNALFVLDSQSGPAWTSINLRSSSVTRFPGENDLAVSAEFLPAGTKTLLMLESTTSIHIPGQEARAGAAAKKPKVLRSQITGKVLKVMVKPGDSVTSGDTLIIIEAMKMENRVAANTTGLVDQVKVTEGDMVSSGAELVKFKQG